jgi:hypothetical protein
MNEQPSRNDFQTVPKTALPALRDVIEDIYDKDELAEKVSEFGITYDNVVPSRAKYPTEIFELLRHFRRNNRLGPLLQSLVDGRPEHAEFKGELIAAIRNAPPSWFGVEQKEFVLTGVLVAAVVASAGWLYFWAPWGSGDLVIHPRRLDLTALPHLYVGYHSKKMGPDRLAAEPVQAEYHIEMDDIAPQTIFTFNPDPAGPQGRCDPECYQIKKIAYEAPNALFIFLEAGGK